MTIQFQVNGATLTTDVDTDTPLLWALREEAHLTGTKFGCGIGVCGACSVHVDGDISRSCMLPISAIAGRNVTTIEGLAADDTALHPLQRAWIAHQVPQCGYCQSGQLMAAAALLRATPTPSDSQIDAAMTNICRCATYPRLRDAIRSVIAAANVAPTSPVRERSRGQTP
jgi:isoquinoline 1-oxidoreductase subunit alpha